MLPPWQCRLCAVGAVNTRKVLPHPVYTYLMNENTTMIRDVDSAAASAVTPREERRVLAATVIGTTVEMFDFLVYAQAAGIVFGALFFGPLGQSNPGLATVLSFATVGISFLFRPLGAIIGGHLGDTIGRKRTLALTLFLMGGATVAIGLLPTYAQIGAAAPLLLIALRVLQGISAGGEWGGAVLLSVEHAPVGRRGRNGAFPQIGVPAGLALASATILLTRAAMSEEQFMSFGWRIPFLCSLVLVVIGIVIRRAVDESPVFVEMQQLQRRSSAPIGRTFREQWRRIVHLALVFAGNNACGYIIIAFMGTYAIKTWGLPQVPVMLCLLLAAVLWIGTTLWGGVLSDAIGRVRAHQLGFVLQAVAMVPMFLLVDRAGADGSLWLFGVGVVLLIPGLGLSYGPTSSMFAELFPAELRYSGISLAYALGSIIGGAFSAMIAQMLLNRFDSSLAIAAYMIAMSLVGLLAVSFVKESRNAPLRQEARVSE